MANNIPPIDSTLTGSDLVAAINDRFRRVATSSGGTAGTPGATGPPGASGTVGAVNLDLEYLSAITTIPRNIAATLAESTSVAQFGVLGDGMYHAGAETAAVQLAMNTMAANGGWLRIPAGYDINIGGDTLTIPSNLKLIGDGSGLCGFIGDGTVGTNGMFLLAAVQNVSMGGFRIEGSVVTPVGIPYATAGSPNDAQWVTGTSIHITSGSADIDLWDIWGNHTGGYFLYWYGNIVRLTTTSCRVTNSRPTVMGIGGDFNYFGWNGGIFGGSDGTSAFFADIDIECDFSNVTGHCFWTHADSLPSTPVMNRRVSFRGTLEDHLGDGTEPGDIDTYTEDIVSRRGGQICAGASTGFTTPGVLQDVTLTGARIPKWLHIYDSTLGGPVGVPNRNIPAVVMDTTGILLNALRRFVVDGFNGVLGSGDGTGQCTWTGVGTSAFASTDPLINISLCGDPASSYAGIGYPNFLNYCSGLVTSNSQNVAAVGQGINITDCTLKGCGYISIGGYAMRFSSITNCVIQQPIVQGQISPITLGSIGSGGSQRTYSVKIFGTHIEWPASGGAAIAESTEYGSFTSGDTNWVDSSNTTTAGALFAKDSVTGSNSGTWLHSTVTAGATGLVGTFISTQGIDLTHHAYKMVRSDGAQMLAVAALVVLAGPGTQGNGCLATGDRSTTTIQDCVVTGVQIADGFIVARALTAGNTGEYSYTTRMTTLLGAGAYFGLRANGVTGAWEQCISNIAGVPQWAPLGGTLNYTALAQYDWSFVVGSGVTGSLGSAGANSVTFTTVPVGVVPGVSVYLHGGSGAGEACQITNVIGSVVSFSTVNAHTGSWTIQSATRGLQEQLAIPTTNNYPFVVIGRSDSTPSFGTVDAAMLVGRNTSDSLLASSSIPRITLQIHTEYNGTLGSASSIYSDMNVSNTTGGNSCTTTVSMLFADSMSAAGTVAANMTAAHAEARIYGLAASSSQNCEGTSLGGSHSGWVSNTGLNFAGPIYFVSGGSWSGGGGGQATYNYSVPAWNVSVNYDYADMASYLGVTYQSTTGGTGTNTGHTPFSGSSWWMVFSSPPAILAPYAGLTSYVNVIDAVPSGYNVQRALVVSVGAGTVTVQMTTNPGGYSSGGRIQQSPQYFGGQIFMHHQAYNTGSGLLIRADINGTAAGLTITSSGTGFFTRSTQIDALAQFNDTLAHYGFAIIIAQPDGNNTDAPSMQFLKGTGTGTTKSWNIGAEAGSGATGWRIAEDGGPFLGTGTDRFYIAPGGNVTVNGTTASPSIAVTNGYVQAAQGFLCQTAGNGLHCNNGGSNNGYFFVFTDNNLYVAADNDIHLQSGGGAGGNVWINNVLQVPTIHYSSTLSITTGVTLGSNGLACGGITIGAFSVNSSGVISTTGLCNAASYEVAGTPSIDSSNIFRGAGIIMSAGINIGSNGIICGGFDINGTNTVTVNSNVMMTGSFPIPSYTVFVQNGFIWKVV